MPSEIDAELNVISQNIESQKGVFTVIITLAVYKILHPVQDIRYHQENMVGGFSGRSNDTKFITPTLKELKLTSMSESGWLTRSLEQPYPYDLNYNGKVGKPEVKKSFLKVVDFIQNNPTACPEVVKFLLRSAINIRNENQVVIVPITNPEKITIEIIIKSLEEFFNSNYNISGGSKIPVLAFYAIYSIMIKEMYRYDGCLLNPLGSHTSSDRTSKTSGDIEISFEKGLLESLEIKFNHEIDSHMINRAIEKIYIYNPKRYYILSTYGIKTEDFAEVINKVRELKINHGCQIIINGLMPTLKYYLRLINNIEDFIEGFTSLVVSDTELKVKHKETWKQVYEKYFN